MESEVRPTGVQLSRKSTDTNRDWVVHQAGSLLQNIYVIANFFLIMGNYFSELR